MTVSRRTALSLAAAAAAAPTLATAQTAPAPVPRSGRQVPGFYRFMIGDIEVTSLHDGQVNREMTPAFIPNAPLEDVLKVMRDQFMPTTPAVSPFNTMVVNVGGRLTLIDSGFSNNGAPTTGRMAENMAAAGIDPKAISTVLISHFHPDHINGVRNKEGELVYPNAEIIVPQRDWAFYMDDARMNAAPEAGRAVFNVARRVFSPVAKDVKQAEWGKEWVPGITAIQSDGHTPGHTSFVVASGNRTLLVIGDASNDPRLFARNPEWHLMFDLDRAKSVETRKKLLDMASTDRMQVTFYHAAFPATGNIAKTATGYDWFPISYSAVL
jgi:glyoxylase-like metal-dependent hydrolase (beta-lactamase superfamily II)